MRRHRTVRSTASFGSCGSKVRHGERPGKTQGRALRWTADCRRIYRRRLARSLALLTLIAIVSSCVTNLRPVQCAGQRYRCNEHHDVKFCEYEVVDIAGPDCASLGLATSKHFCVAEPARCVQTHFELKGLQCDVVSYRGLGEWSECPAGVPIFEDP
jgi:hypothetical protein